MAVKHITTWLSITAIGLGLASAYLGWTLTEERARARSSAEEHAQLRETIAEMKEQEQRLQNQLAAAKRPSANAVAEGGGTSPGVAASSAAMSGTGTGIGRLTKSLGPLHMPELEDEHRVTMTRMRYAKLLRDIGIPDEQLEALLPVLASLEYNKHSTGVSMLELSEQERGHYLDEVAKVVGHERAEQVLQVKQQMPVRMELGSIKVQLDALGAPLSKQQENDLVTKLSTLAPSSPFPQQLGERTGPDTFRKWQQDRHQRFLSAAEGVLTPQQRTRISEVHAMNAAMSSGFTLPHSASGSAGSAAP